MAANVPLDTFHQSYEAFRDAAAAVPEPQFAAPMGAGRWSARDTVAHLTAWNREMIQAGRDILAGKAPYYYSESTIDYRDMNDRFVNMYAAYGKTALLAELATTLAELESFIRALDPAELEADHGVVHYRGGPGTVVSTINSLGRDYQHHAEEIAAWLGAQNEHA